ncbi:MAG: hypothetical protein LBV38_00740 [Alistipes sp.]|jgi:hypothetical protein|nr:hypothetical protein [Alistipes sp.]
MEDKTLTTDQSIDLIARMIASARRNFSDNGGAMFLIWGYTTIAVTVAVYATFLITRSLDAMWLWWAIPAVSGALTWRHYRKYRRPVQNHIDKAVGHVWVAFTVAVVACMVYGFVAPYLLPEAMLSRVPQFPILFIISLMIAMCTAITGLLIRFRPVAVAGFAGIPLAFVVLVADGMMWQFAIFAGLFLVVQVIPGHLLNRHCRAESRSGLVDVLCYGGAE